MLKKNTDLKKKEKRKKKGSRKYSLYIFHIIKPFHTLVLPDTVMVYLLASTSTFPKGYYHFSLAYNVISMNFNSLAYRQTTTHLSFTRDIASLLAVTKLIIQVLLNAKIGNAYWVT